MATLIVEDGSVVQNANTLVSLIEFTAYLEQYSHTLSGDASLSLIKANDALFMFNFKGSLVDTVQTCVFPRKNLEIYGVTVESNTVLPQIKKAQMELAIAIDAGFDPLTNVGASSRNIKSASAGPLSITYSGTGETKPLLQAVITILKPLLKNGGGNVVFDIISPQDFLGGCH